MKSHKSLTFLVRRQIVQTHVVGGRATSFVRGMSCAMDLVPVSTVHWRRRRLEKSSCLSFLISDYGRDIVIKTKQSTFIVVDENISSDWNTSINASRRN